MKTCMYSSKLRGLQKTFEIHCQPLHVTEEMFYFETRCDYHPLASCIMYTVFQAGDEGYGSQIANSLVKLVDVTWKGKDLGLNYVSLVPIVELLLVNNQEIWSVFESLGMSSMFYFFCINHASYVNTKTFNKNIYCTKLLIIKLSTFLIFFVYAFSILHTWCVLYALITELLCTLKIERKSLFLFSALFFCRGKLNKMTLSF